MQFEWDFDKAKSNLEKHQVAFDESESVFGDPLARIFDDIEHSIDEKRNLIIGRSIQNRLLIVSFTERENDTIRIISVRETSPKERRKFKNANE